MQSLLMPSRLGANPMINHNEDDEDLSMIICDQCHKNCCLLVDLWDETEYVIVGAIAQIEGCLYHFCSKRCLKEFVNNGTD